MGCHKYKHDPEPRRWGKASVTSLELNFLTRKVSGNKDSDYLAELFSSFGEVRNVEMFGKGWKL